MRPNSQYWPKFPSIQNPWARRSEITILAQIPLHSKPLGPALAESPARRGRFSEITILTQIPLHSKPLGPASAASPVRPGRFQKPQSWDHGTMGPWDHGAMRPWDHGTMGPWDRGAMGPWDHGSRAPSTGAPEHEHRYSGTVRYRTLAGTPCNRAERKTSTR